MEPLHLRPQGLCDPEDLFPQVAVLDWPFGIGPAMVTPSLSPPQDPFHDQLAVRAYEEKGGGGTSADAVSWHQY